MSARTDWTAATLLGVVGLGFVAAVAGDVALRPRLARAQAAEARRRTAAPATLPDLQLVTQAGQVRRLADGGGVVLLVSAGCPHCRRVVERLAARTATEPPRLQVVVLEGHAAAAGLLGSAPFQALAPAQAPRRFLEDIGAPGVPMLFWVRPDRQVLARTMGEISDDEAALWLERAAQAEAAHGS